MGEILLNPLYRQNGLRHYSRNTVVVRNHLCILPQNYYFVNRKQKNIRIILHFLHISSKHLLLPSLKSFIKINTPVNTSKQYFVILYSVNTRRVGMVSNIQPSKSTARLPELSVLSIIFCVLVVFIHASAEPVTNLLKDSFAYFVVFMPWRLSAFVVQGFLLISGIKLFLKPVDNLHYGRFLLGKAKTIALPYVIWCVVYYAFFVFVRRYFPFSVTDLFGYIVKGDLVGHFYFVIAILQFFILMPLWRYIVKRFDSAVTLPISLLITIIMGQNLTSIIGLFFPTYWFAYNDRIFTTYLFYFLCGCYIGKSYEAFKQGVLSHKVAISVLFAVNLLLDGSLSYMAFRGFAVLTYLDTIHVLYCISAILFFYMLSAHACSKVDALPAFLSNIDRASYIIYLSHPLCIFVVDDLMTFAPLSTLTRYAIRIVFTYCITFSLCIAYSKIKRSLKRK